jgi:hypothetical protein
MAIKGIQTITMRITSVLTIVITEDLIAKPSLTGMMTHTGKDEILNESFKTGNNYTYTYQYLYTNSYIYIYTYLHTYVYIH